MKTPAIVARLVLFTAIASLGIAYHRTSHASALPACDAQAIAKAGRGYVCTVKTKGGPISWRVEVPRDLDLAVGQPGHFHLVSFRDHGLSPLS